MTAPTPAGASDLTRRQALQAGGATAAAAFVLLHPWATAFAQAADASGDVPKHLLRSTYVDLPDPYFRSGASVLRLEGISDLPAAPEVASLVNSEDAFALILSGPRIDGAATGPVQLSHAEIGSFPMYLGAPTDDGHYAVIVNRVLSNRESRRTPPKPARTSPGTGASAAPVDEGHDTRTGSSAGAAAAGPAPKRRNKVIRSVETKRTKGGAKVVVELSSAAGLGELTGWLKRDERLVASATRRVHGKRVAFNLKPAKRLRKGVYELTLIATDDDGEQHSRVVRVRLK